MAPTTDHEQAAAFVASTHTQDSEVLSEDSARYRRLAFALGLTAIALGIVLLGLVVPLLLIAIPRTRTPLGISVASTLVIVSMFVKRYLITVPPQTQPLIGGGTASYSPSLVELLVVVGAAAGIPLTVMILFRVFPVLSVFEITEIERQQAEDRERAAARTTEPTGATATERSS